MFSRFQKPAPVTVENFPSAARLAEQENLSYLEAAEKLRQMGRIPTDDPRAHLDPARVRSFSERRMGELMHDFNSAAQSGYNNATSRDLRTQYAAVLKAGSGHLDILRKEPNRVTDLAASAEFMALRLAKSDPKNPSVKDLLVISAAASDRGQRERASVGFDTNNIAKAAKTQGRSWLDVRDDLAKFNLIDKNDPRMKVRQADVLNQKGGILMRSNTLPPEDLESVAMRRLKKNPKDELGTAWLATAGYLSTELSAKKVKGAEVQAIVPAKQKLFGTAAAARRRAANIELGG